MQTRHYILIVETDDLIRDLLERWLSEAGYALTVASPGMPARDDAPSLVIANVSSPRGAKALVTSLQAKYPAPILAISARFRRGLGASKEAARRFGVRKVLPKPFTRGELLAAVRDALENE